MAEIAIPYELETPRGTLEFNTADDNGDTLRLAGVEGLDGAVVRSAVHNRPQAPGAIVFPSIDGARYPILTGYLHIVESSETTMLNRRRALEDRIRTLLRSIRAEPGILRWTPNGAPTRRLEGVQLIDRPTIAGGVVKEFAIALIAADPVVYSDSEYALNTSVLLPGVGSWQFPFSFPFSFGSESSGGTANVYNGGDEEAWPTIDIYGQIIGPRVVNHTNGYEVALPSLSVPAGQYAEIDMRNETVYLNGSTDVNLAGSLNVPASFFWPLELGDNVVQLLAAGFQSGAYAQVRYRHTHG